MKTNHILTQEIQPKPIQQDHIQYQKAMKRKKERQEEKKRKEDHEKEMKGIQQHEIDETNYYFEKNYTPTNLVKVTNVDFIKRNNQTMTLEKSTLDNYVMLYNEASKLGLNLTLFSGYRSYSYQENLPLMIHIKP